LSLCVTDADLDQQERQATLTRSVKADAAADASDGEESLDDSKQLCHPHSLH